MTTESRLGSDVTSLTRSVTVDAPIELAFEVFTTRFDTWWPREHHIGNADLAEASIEPFVGGRWLERDVDGSECEWGRVLEYDPPVRIALSWHLNGEFTYDPDPEHASRVEVRFVVESPTRTRVELTHSQLDRHAGRWQDARDGIGGEGGWGMLLQRFANAVA